MNRSILSVALIALTLAGHAQAWNSTTEGRPPVRNIILLIGDGMGTTQVSAGITANGGHLNMEACTDIGFSKTSPADGYITDSGAAATAISTGYKSFTNAIGMDRDTVARETILEYAEKEGKATGVVVTSQVTHATPAAFMAHQPSRYMYEAIADDILHSGVDVFIGGGLKYFNQRADGKDLTLSLVQRGYRVVTSTEELENVSEGKLAGLLYADKPPRWSEGRGDMLPASVRKAIELLNEEEKGFFLMVEGSQIDWGGHDNDTDYILEELLDFDRAVGEALKFAREDGHTLVIVTADHETGGMSLTGGDLMTGEVKASYSCSGHTGVMVPVFSFGPQADLFRGIYENTELFRKMMNAFGIEPAGMN